MRKGVLLGAAVILASIAGALAGDQIRLKSRNFTPEPGISNGAKARIEAATGGKAHVLIQLDRKMTRAYRKSLEAQGVTLLGYIPQLAWFAAVDPDKAEGIAAISGMRAVCEILPQDKISPSIRRVGINAFSTTESGQANLLVMFFQDVSMAQARAIIAGEADATYLTPITPTRAPTGPARSSPRRSFIMGAFMLPSARVLSTARDRGCSRASMLRQAGRYGRAAAWIGVL